MMTITATPTLTPTATITPTATPTFTPTPTYTADFTATQLIYIDLPFTNTTWAGNPYDLIASVTFTHTTSTLTRTTEMFYAGGNSWIGRFAAEESGLWDFSTSSVDPDLDGHSGLIEVDPSAYLGFVEASNHH